MPKKTLRIVSRESPLALWQAGHVRTHLLTHHPGLEISIIGISTAADRFLDRSLASMGGKGVFVKELEQALLAGDADMAVHSMKDVTVDLPAQLALPVIMRREDPTDVLVSNQFSTLSALPEGACIGTSSLRRQCQLKAWRPDLRFVGIRGNIATRLARLDAGDYDALILAAAGLKRLNLQHRIQEHIAVDVLLPAVGQGALGIETRADDEQTQALIAVLHDSRTATCVTAERAFSRCLYGGCHLPIAAYATLLQDKLMLRGLVGRPDGSEVIRQTATGGRAAERLGAVLGRRLLEQGADNILQGLGVDADR